MSDVILSYLEDLSQNNERGWYHAHEAQRKAAQADFQELVSRLAERIRQFDGAIPLCRSKDLTFKLERDTRFSRDKSPYNPAFRCHIAPAGKLPVPTGYYLLIRAGEGSFLGGGLFADMFRDATRLVREGIRDNADAFLAVVNDPAFRRDFQVAGAALKNVPREFPADSPAAAYLKNKSWYVEYPFPAERLTDRAAFVDFAAEKFEQMKPFNDFLNRALAGFTMPTRPEKS